jgi:hypothetical protein
MKRLAVVRKTKRLASVGPSGSMRAWALWAAALAALAAPASGANVKATPADLEGVSIHTVFSAECTPYFDWQSLALVRSHRLVRLRWCR